MLHHLRTTALWAALLSAVIVGGLARPALADPRDISVGGVYITRITHDASGYTSYERATQVNKRITQVLGTPEFRHGAVLAVKEMGRSAIITVGDQLVFTVTPEDAAGTSMTPLVLARQWAQLLAQGLSKALPASDFHVF